MELTVYGLRPLNLTGLVNKNTGDPAGDLFFYLTDRFVAPFACRFTKGRWWACHEQVCVCARAHARACACAYVSVCGRACVTVFGVAVCGRVCRSLCVSVRW